MLILFGYIIVILSVFGGYVLSGGSLGPLYQPTELLIIGGAGVGAFCAASNGKALKATLNSIRKLKPSTQYDKAMYMEVMALLYAVLSKARKEGMLAIEKEIETPEESALFSAYPRALADKMIMEFVIDYLRLMISGNMNPHEVDELMLHEIETYEHEAGVPAGALTKVSDALPAFGIVAAVMGVVKALSAADLPPEEMGLMIAHALVGTFLGILLAYGFVGPVATRMERQVAEAVKMLQCMRVTLQASLNGYAPQIAIEFGRKTLGEDERPSALELEEFVRENAPGRAAGGA